MHYYAKLVRGGVYMVFGKVFNAYEEQEVTKQEYLYLKDVHESDLVPEGNNYKITKLAKFECREVEPSLEEKVFEEVGDDNDSLKPKRPRQAA
jgi:hypothetical protein